MNAFDQLLTQHLDLWASAIKRKSAAGRGSSNKIELYGINKLRELILELAMRGLLVPQDPNEEPASELLKKVTTEKARLAKEGKVKKEKPLPAIDEDKVPFQLPSGWAWSCLAALGEIGPRNEADDGAAASFVPMPLVSTNYDGSHSHEERKWSEIKKGYTHFADGDVAIAKITPCFENSKAAIFSGLHNGIGAGTTELHVLRLFGEYINRKYVLLYLKSPQFLIIGESRMTGSAGQKRVPTEFFAYNPIPLPPLAEQHRIAAKVDELMALCDQLEQQTETSISAHQTLGEALLNALASAEDHAQFASAWQRIAAHFDTLFTTEQSIDQLKQTLLQLAVMGKLVAQDPSDDSVERWFDSQLVANKTRRGVPTQVQLPDWIGAHAVPAGWTKRSIADLLRTNAIHDIKDGNHGANHPVKGDWTVDGLPFITAAQVNNYEIDYNGANKLSGKPLSKLKVGFSEPGDVIYTHKGSVGRTAINYRPCVLSPQTTYYRPNEQVIFNRYLMYFFQSLFFRRQVDEVKSQTTRDFVSISQQYLFCILVPPVREQHQIVAKLDELLELCNRLLNRLRDVQTIQLHLADAMAEKVLTGA